MTYPCADRNTRYCQCSTARPCVFTKNYRKTKKITACKSLYSVISKTCSRALEEALCFVPKYKFILSQKWSSFSLPPKGLSLGLRPDVQTILAQHSPCHRGVELRKHSGLEIKKKPILPVSATLLQSAIFPRRLPGQNHCSEKSICILQTPKRDRPVICTCGIHTARIALIKRTIIGRFIP